MKTLILGSGKLKTDDSDTITVDLEGNPKVKHDLNIYPYPFKDNTFDIIHAKYILEHLDDMVKAMQEIHRIGKDGCIVHIAGAHFSGKTLWLDPTHKRGFSADTFDYFERWHPNHYYMGVEFNVIEKKLRWAERNTGKLKPLVRLVEALANRNRHLFERLWCYWVGGFSLVEFKLIVRK